MNYTNIKNAKRLIFAVLFSTALTRAIFLGDLWIIIVSVVTIPAIIILDILETRSAKK